MRRKLSIGMSVEKPYGEDKVLPSRPYYKVDKDFDKKMLEKCRTASYSRRPQRTLLISILAYIHAAVFVISIPACAALLYYEQIPQFFYLLPYGIYMLVVSILFKFYFSGRGEVKSTYYHDQ